MECTESSTGLAFRRALYQLDPTENCNEHFSVDCEEGIQEAVTSSEHTDMQEDELFEQFNTQIFAAGKIAPNSLSATLQTSFLYPNLQTRHSTASYPVGTPELLAPGHEGTGTLHTVSASPFPHLESHADASHYSFPISQPIPPHISTRDPYLPLTSQQHSAPPFLHDPGRASISIPDHVPAFLHDNLSSQPDGFHPGVSIAHAPPLQLPHAYLQEGLNPFSTLPPLLTPSLPLLPLKKENHRSIYPSILPLQTQTGRVLSLGEGKTVFFCPNSGVNGPNLSNLSPSELSSYVLGLLDSNASTSNVILESLQDTLKATDLSRFENFYINLYNVIVENLLVLAKSQKGSLLIIDFMKKVGKEALYFNILNALLSNTKILMSNSQSIGLLQSLLDDFPDEQFLYFCTHIEPDCMAYCYHKQGNHVIQKVITILENKAFVLKEYREMVDRLSAIILRNPSDFLALSDQVCGCRIYQKLFPLIIDEKELINIRDVLLDKFISLCNNQWANFCIQGFIENKRLIHSKIRTAVIERLVKHSIVLCTHKFGSHVIEKFLECCTVKERIDFSMYLFLNPNFPNLMDDSYGNFIVQKMLQQKDSKTDVRLATLWETCGRLCKYYLKKHNYKEQSVRNITCYLNKSLKKIKGIESLSPDKVLDIAKKLDASPWIYHV